MRNWFGLIYIITNMALAVSMYIAADATDTCINTETVFSDKDIQCL